MIDRGRLDTVVTRTLDLDLDAPPIRDSASCASSREPLRAVRYVPVASTQPIQGPPDQWAPSCR